MQNAEAGYTKFCMQKAAHVPILRDSPRSNGGQVGQELHSGQRDHHMMAEWRKRGKELWCWG